MGIEKVSLHSVCHPFYSFLRRLQLYEKLFEGKTTLLLESDSELLKYFRSPRVSGK